MSERVDFSYAIECLELDLEDAIIEMNSWKAVYRERNRKSDKELYKDAKNKVKQLDKAIDLLRVPRKEAFGNQELLFSVLKEIYQDHFIVTDNLNHIDYHDWNNGAMFGIRIALGVLGYDIDFDEWKRLDDNE